LERDGKKNSGGVMETITIPISYLITAASVLVSVCGVIVWLYSTFITRTEAAKIEGSVDRIIEALKEALKEKMHGFDHRLKAIEKKRSGRTA
jgi:hypothetical protein